jgi:hypothetical protein
MIDFVKPVNYAIIFVNLNFFKMFFLGFGTSNDRNNARNDSKTPKNLQKSQL